VWRLINGSERRYCAWYAPYKEKAFPRRHRSLGPLRADEATEHAVHGDMKRVNLRHDPERSTLIKE
jgi:hypothetical protein